MRSIEVLVRQNAPANFSNILKELREAMLELPDSDIYQVCLNLNDQNFDHLLVAIIDRSANDFETICEVTWIALIYFFQKDISLDRLISSQLLVRYEKLLSVPHSLVLEQVR